MKPNLTEIQLSAICELIAKNTGLHFPKERWGILSKNLSQVGREIGLDNMKEFIQLLLKDGLNNDQSDILVSHLTCSETYFWREPQVFAALMDFVLPGLVKSKKNKEPRIRIWSAGCSTGEEPYSIAIALKKTIPDIEKWNISILATDINPKAIRKAASGIYGSWSFRNSPPWLKSGYFQKTGDGLYEVSQEVRKLVSFKSMNLVDSSSLFTDRNIDIIFCRNVLMYLNPEWIARITSSFFDALSEDGWFVVSSCELSSQVFTQFTPVNFKGAVLYRKSKGESNQYMNGQPEGQQNPSYKAFFDHINKTGWATKIDLKISSPIDQLPSFQINLPIPKPLSASEILTEAPIVHAPTSKEALNIRISEIKLLADQGLLGKALLLCNEMILENKLAYEIYFLRASVLQELDKGSEAIASLKQTIYIKPDYIMGHFLLGNLFLRQGNRRNAKKHFNNVIELLDRCEADHNVPESEGLSLEYLRECIFSNMKTLSKK
jgi:chemotaxis protein methyltransferase CheR